MSSLIERTNGLPLSDLVRFLPTTIDANITLYTSSTLPAATLASCFALVKENMMPMYKRSSMSWSTTAKKKEMRHPAMRYIVLHGGKLEGDEVREDKEEGKGKVLGFASFMITEEEGMEVIYCYELHLAPASQGVGNGGRLMTMLEVFGRNVGLKKAMLTVFAENTGAIRFYKRIGYEMDEISPAPRHLRSGKIKEPTYYIFSKQI